ncbi:MAG TPA: HNH endonuclease [bacterium]|nr:HNH endonuclease [bacterium]
MNRVLTLSNAYEPLRIISWQRAVCLFFGGKVDILETYSDLIHSPTMVMNHPAVIRINFSTKTRPKQQSVRFSRTNLFQRDDYKCQYCRIQFNRPQLTMDHLIPKSRGGTTSWTNVVTACKTCNHKKGSKSIDQTRLKLMRKPVAPEWLPALLKFSGNTPEQWHFYLPENGNGNGRKS